jgi:membrane protease YdiL (CAAX protease family)
MLQICMFIVVMRKLLPCSLQTRAYDTLMCLCSLQLVVSSLAFAGSHISSSGFPQLFAFGMILGASHIASKRNILLPTLIHCSFNIFILAVLLLTEFPHLLLNVAR